MFHTSFQIVLGADHDTPVPAAARAHGFTERFALVLSTHSPGIADMVVDPAPLLAALAWLDRRFDSPGVLFWDDAHLRRLNYPTLCSHYHAQPPGDFEVIAGAEWRQAGQLIALLYTERWAHVGGPSPYHDSYTYSFYSASDLSESLLAALRRAGHEPTAVTRVASPGLPTSLFQRLLGALRLAPTSRR